MPPKVLLIAWDAADWNVIHPLLDAGRMPALAKIVEQGASGRLSTVQPIAAPITWTSLATGNTPDRHRVLRSWTDPAASFAVSPLRFSGRRVPALWERLSAAGLRTHVVGWPYARPVEGVSGVFVQPQFAYGASPTSAEWPLTPDSVFPGHFGEALEDLRIHPASLNAEIILPFVPKARDIDQSRDNRLSFLGMALSATCSLHNAATWLLEREEWDFLAVCSHGIGDFSRMFMAYHPPRLPDVSPREFEMFQHAVTEIYCFHDRLLGRLVELAGDRAAVILVSNHGYQSGGGRPGASFQGFDAAAAWNREAGILAIGGPDAAPDEIVHGASILDIAPTVLALLGAPGGEELDGRPLREAWTRFPAPASPSAAKASPAVTGEVAEQFVAFQALAELTGLEADPPGPPSDSTRFNEAVAYMTTSRPSLALPILERLFDAAPESLNYAHALVQCRLALGQTAAAKQMLAALFAGPERHQWMYYFHGLCLLRDRDRAAALAAFREAETFYPVPAFLPAMIGTACAAGRLWAEAEASFLRALELDPDNAMAHLGMASVELQRRNPERAAGHALTSIGIRYHQPAAHCQLAVALARMGRYEKAEVALRAALHLAPQHRGAKRLLGGVLARKAMRGAGPGDS